MPLEWECEKTSYQLAPEIASSIHHGYSKVVFVQVACPIILPNLAKDWMLAKFPNGPFLNFPNCSNGQVHEFGNLLLR